MEEVTQELHSIEPLVVEKVRRRALGVEEVSLVAIEWLLEQRLTVPPRPIADGAQGIGEHCQGCVVRHTFPHTALH